jgi:hypothetical protein
VFAGLVLLVPVAYYSYLNINPPRDDASASSTAIAGQSLARQPGLRDTDEST